MVRERVVTVLSLFVFSDLLRLTSEQGLSGNIRAEASAPGPGTIAVIPLVYPLGSLRSER